MNCLEIIDGWCNSYKKGVTGEPRTHPRVSKKELIADYNRERTSGKFTMLHFSYY